MTLKIDEDINAIKERNARVEGNKAWEQSYTRRFLIAAFTYLTVVVFLISAGHENPWLHALVPPFGYLLSTLSLPWIKQWWMKKYYKDQT